MNVSIMGPSFICIKNLNTLISLSGFFDESQGSEFGIVALILAPQDYLLTPLAVASMSKEHTKPIFGNYLCKSFSYIYLLGA